MRIGVVFPQTEIGADPGGIRAYAQAVTDLGYAHILAYDHVVGADPAVHTGWAGPYDIDTTFHEPFVLFGFLAGLTELELVTGIIILPQRQTVLVAKQAAEVDLLTGGRFRLGVGVGWNKVEYDALGQDFTTRGAREEEQIGLLRRLWTERSISFAGAHDQVDGAGSVPAARPTAHSRVAGRRQSGRVPPGRAGGRRLVPHGAAGPQARRGPRPGDEAATAAGRDPTALGMEGRLDAGDIAPDDLGQRTRAWRDRRGPPT